MSEDEEGGWSFRPAMRTSEQKKKAAAAEQKRKEDLARPGGGHPNQWGGRGPAPAAAGSGSAAVESLSIDTWLEDTQAGIAGTSFAKAFVDFSDRFSRRMAEVDTAWTELQNEKEAGWKSEALDQQWRRTKAKFEKMDRAHNRGSVPNTRKYVANYRNRLPELNGDLFRRRDWGCDSESGRFFADLGSAPGGLSEHLVQDLGWRGSAFSLDPQNGGFAMRFEDQRLAFHPCDMAKEGSWRRSIGCLARGESCHFVNAGVVMDKGQKSQSAPEETGGQQDLSLALYFVSIYVNEALFALHALAPGGAFLLVYQPGHYAMLFSLLLLLRPLFSNVRVTSTHEPGRTPIYCYLGGFAGLQESSAAVRSLEAFELPVFDAAGWSEHGADPVSGIYRELKADLHTVWGRQMQDLRSKRELAEREFRR